MGAAVGRAEGVTLGEALGLLVGRVVGCALGMVGLRVEGLHLRPKVLV